MSGEVGLQAFKKPGPVAGALSGEMRLVGGKAWGLSAPPPAQDPFLALRAPPREPDRCQPHTNQVFCPTSAAPCFTRERETEK